METEQLLQRLAAADLADLEATPEPAPARLKSRLYSALIERQSESGPLRPLAASKADGNPLCVFEQLLVVLPGDNFSATNPCRTCHARVLAERLDWAPIFWPGCPYSKFHNP